ncbi:hypothetical protein HS125_07565 [bacterium]|nr:hypothetical protein [bacterium]
MGFWSLFLVYLIGFILIIIDVFLPGGILATCGGIILAIGVGITYYQHGAAAGTTALISSLLSATLVVIVGYQVIARTRLARRAFLDPERIGNRPNAPSPVAALVGRTGVTLTDLRPAGRVQVDGEPYDALATGQFIPAGRKVVVTGTEMNSLVVTEA